MAIRKKYGAKGVNIAKALRAFVVAAQERIEADPEFAARVQELIAADVESTERKLRTNFHARQIIFGNPTEVD